MMYNAVSYTHLTILKKNKLRYNEYYDMQHIYDELYAQSRNGNNFYRCV